MKTRKVALKPILVSLHQDKETKGLIVKRELTLQESRYILSNILFVQLSTRSDFEDKEEYAGYNQELTEDVNKWMKGDLGDDVLMNNYASDCGAYPIGIWNSIRIIEYLQARGVL